MPAPTPATWARRSSALRAPRIGAYARSRLSSRRLQAGTVGSKRRAGRERKSRLLACHRSRRSGAHSALGFGIHKPDCSSPPRLGLVHVGAGLSHRAPPAMASRAREGPSCAVPACHDRRTAPAGPTPRQGGRPRTACSRDPVPIDLAQLRHVLVRCVSFESFQVLDELRLV